MPNVNDAAHPDFISYLLRGEGRRAMHAEEPINRVRMLLEQMDSDDPESAIEISDND